VTNINFYLVDGPDVIVEPAQAPLNGLSKMITGNAPYDGGFLLLSDFEAAQMVSEHPDIGTRLRRVYGSSELLDGVSRFCLWFKDDEREFAQNHPASQDRIRGVLNYRRTGGEVAQTLIERPHQFRYRHEATNRLIVVPQVSSERRHYLPVGFLDQKAIVTHLAHAIYDSDLVDFAVLSSKLHLSWIATVCGKMKTDFRYSSTLGWNTFPVPTLTDAHKADLTRCAEDILLAREAHFPKTIADLYEPDAMPDDLRRAHDRNDETLERIYIGRRFKNDTERLEKLFDLYTKMTKAEAAKSAGNGNGKGRKKNGAGANGGST
jgi:hypothetical protein